MFQELTSVYYLVVSQDQKLKRGNREERTNFFVLFDVKDVHRYWPLTLHPFLFQRDNTLRGQSHYRCMNLGHFLSSSLFPSHGNQAKKKKMDYVRRLSGRLKKEERENEGQWLPITLSWIENGDQRLLQFAKCVNIADVWKFTTEHFLSGQTCWEFRATSFP